MIGEARVDISPADPLEVGDALVAQQFVDDAGGQSYVSAQSSSLEVVNFEGDLPTPRIEYDVWGCGRRVIVEGGVPGAQVVTSHVDSSDGEVTEIGSKWANKSLVKVSTYLEEAWAIDRDEVQAQQFICPEAEEGSKSSGISEPAPIRWYQSGKLPPPQEIRWAEDGFKIRSTEKYVGATYWFTDDDSGDEIFRYPGATRPGANAILRDPADDSWQIVGKQKLCEGSESDPSPDPVSGNPPQSVSVPKIVEPVCVGVEYVRVKTNPDVGNLFLRVDDGSIHTTITGVTPGETYIAPTQPLAMGDQLSARHKLPSTKSSWSNDVLVQDDNLVFELLGKKTYINQNSGGQLEGFVVEESRGPVFSYTECCAGSFPQAPVVTIKDAKGATVTTITLQRQYAGHYTGRWDWFVDDPVHPKPNHDYTAEVVSPCSEKPLTATVRAFKGSVDTSDASAPTVELSVEGMTRGDGDSFNLDPGNISYSAKGEDGDGVQSISVSRDGSLLTDKSASPEPIVPLILTSSGSFELGPGQMVELEAKAENFASSPLSDSVRVSITGNGVTPEIDTINDVQPGVAPAEFFTTQKFSIQGDHLFYSNATTTVEVVGVSDPSKKHTITVVGSGSSKGELEDLSLQGSPLSGYHGLVDVTVKLDYGSGIKESNNVQAKLLDIGKFEKGNLITGDQFFDFEKKLKTTCAGGPGSVKSMTYTQGEGGVTVEFREDSQGNKRPNELFDWDFFTVESGQYCKDAEIKFDEWPAPGEENDPNSKWCKDNKVNLSQSRIGGMVFTDNCRNAVLVTYDSNPGGNPLFNVWFYYFPEDETKSSVKVNLGMVENFFSQGGVFLPKWFQVHSSKNGSVMAFYSIPTWYAGPSDNTINFSAGIFWMADGGNRVRHDNPTKNNNESLGAKVERPGGAINKVDLYFGGSRLIDHTF